MAWLRCPFSAGVIMMALLVCAHCRQLEQTADVSTKRKQPVPRASDPLATTGSSKVVSQVQQQCAPPLINWPIGSAYCWNVRDSEGQEQGPGSNVFDPAGVSIQPNGQLVLEVRANQGTGEFSSAEVYLDRSLGFGDYIWTVATDPKQIHHGLVGSPFIYADDTQEFDIEHSRWGDPAAENTNYAVQPSSETVPGTYKVFTVGGTRLTHRLRWGGPRLSQMRFETFSASGALLKSWTPTAGNPIVTPGNEAVHINFWIFDKEATGLPSRSTFVVNCFKFCPLGQQETCSSALGKRPCC